MKVKKQRIISLIVCIAFVLALFFSALFIAKAINHDCTGESCPICAEIKASESVVKGLSDGIIPADSGFTATIVFFCAVFIFCFNAFPHSSLIAQKVRLDN